MFITNRIFDDGMKRMQETRDKAKKGLPYTICGREGFNWEDESSILFLHDYYSIPIADSVKLFYNGQDRDAISEWIKRQQEREHHFT